MNIVMLLYPNSKMGGILTVHNNLLAGLRRSREHRVIDYYLSENKKTPTVPGHNTKNCKQLYCSGRSLGIVDSHVKETIRKIGSPDVVMYSTPAPSLNRAFSDPAWMEIPRTLKKLGCKQVVFWHDPFCEQFYPWVKDIADCIDVIACIQKKAYDNVPSQLKHKAFICNHPMDLSTMCEPEKDKENLIISPHQFKSWKNINLFVQAAPKILAAGCGVEVFNTGIEYYFMAGSLAKRKPKYKVRGKWIWDEAVKAGMQYHGMVSEKQLITAFKRQKVVADLSVGELGNKKGTEYRSLNYAVLEAMLYGGVPVVRKHSVLPPFTEDNFILLNEDSLVESTIDCCIRAVQEWDTKGMYNLRSANRRILIDTYSATRVASSILERV